MELKNNQKQPLYRIVESDFKFSADKSEVFPEIHLPEVCIIGRSNVGKSSLINELLERKKIARVGKKPGVTKVICFYKIRYKTADEEEREGEGFLVDLPGFGYAKTGQTNRESWSKLISSYLGSRENLQAVILLLDVRREIGKEERELLQLTSGEGIVIGVTKCDKLNQKEFNVRKKYFKDELGAITDKIYFVSNLSKQGQREIDSLRDQVVSYYEPDES